MTRTEKDFLGERELPKQAYYGIQTLRAVENFPITGRNPHEKLILGVVYVKHATATANISVGLLDNVLGQAIIQASEEMLSGRYLNEIKVDAIQGGAGTSLNMNVNEVIANRALEILGFPKGDYHTISPNTHVNKSQSTNDVFPTAFRIAVLQSSIGLKKALNHLIQTLHLKGKEFDHVIKMGRTHLQDAVPIRLGQEFVSYAMMIQRDLKRFERALEPFLEVNLGATAVGTGINALPQYVQCAIQSLSELTGYRFRSVENLMDATQNTDVYVQLSSSLKLMAINLSKIANDLRLMASGPRVGLAEIQLPPRQPGSSIMPGKVNPVICEGINQIAFQVMGNDLTVSLASGAGQLELNVMEPVLFDNVLESLTILQNGINVFTDLAIAGIKANEVLCQEGVERSIGVVTALVPHLGYELSSMIAYEALETGKLIRKICVDRNLFTTEQLDTILDPWGMTTPGISGAKHLNIQHITT